MPIANNGFYNPGYDYGSLAGTAQTTNSVWDMLTNETNRQGQWLRYVTANGYNPLTSTGGVANGMYDLAQQGYDAAYIDASKAKKNLTWSDYLQSLDLRGTLASLSPRARGERPDQYAGPVRFQPRGQ